MEPDTFLRDAAEMDSDGGIEGYTSDPETMRRTFIEYSEIDSPLPRRRLPKIGGEFLEGSGEFLREKKDKLVGAITEKKKSLYENNKRVLEDHNARVRKFISRTKEVVDEKREVAALKMRDVNDRVEQRVKVIADAPKKIRARTRLALTGDEARSVREHLRMRRLQLAAMRDEPPVVRLLDKVSFSFGVLNVMFTEFLLLEYPEHFWMWYCIEMFSCLGVRFFHYRTMRWQYFLLDFCYFANVVLVFYLWLAPTNVALFQICFAFANGPLGLAIVAWRNSLVFHSLDKTTSLFIHIEPVMVSYAIRH
jgi:hypothetical protein